jgi:hypothetical protein
MKSRLPETVPARSNPLPAGQIALEAYWQIGRHLPIYGGQILALSVLGWFMETATGIIVYTLMGAAGPTASAAAIQLAYIGTVVTVLILGGTAICISCQRAIVLAQAPSVRYALRLQRGELRVLRAVCVYWLIVHLVPTLVVNMGYVTEPLGLMWIPRLPIAAGYAFYWGWVLVTAPLVVLSLPIALFETATDPLAAARHRLNGHIGRLFVAGAIAFAPLAVVEIGLHLLADALGPFEPDTMSFWFVDVLVISILQLASSFAVILVMSALVAAAYLRLSPRLETVYRVFD